MKLDKNKLFICFAYENAYVGFHESSDRTLVEIGTGKYNLEHICFTKKYVSVTFNSSTNKEIHFFTHGNGIWHVDEYEYDDFKTTETTTVLTDMVKSVANLFRDELSNLDANYGTNYAEFAA